MCCMSKAQRYTVYELFTFNNGVRYAWVTYELPVGGERRCVAVSETKPR